MSHLRSVSFASLLRPTRSPLSEKTRDYVFLELLAAFDLGKEALSVPELREACRLLGPQALQQALIGLADLGLVQAGAEAKTIGLSEQIKEERRLTLAVTTPISQNSLLRPSSLAER